MPGKPVNKQVKQIKQGPNRKLVFREVIKHVKNIKAHINLLKKTSKQKEETLENETEYHYNMAAIFYNIGVIHSEYLIIIELLEIYDDSSTHHREDKKIAVPYCDLIATYFNDIQERVDDDAERDYNGFIPLIFMNMGKFESAFEAMINIMRVNDEI